MCNSKFLLFFSFFVFLVSFVSSSFNNNTRKCSTQQSLALLHFKHSLSSINDSTQDYPCHYWLGYEYYPVMMNWKMSIDCCKWDGVTCNDFTGDVIALDLSCGMLRGTIHPNTTLLNLDHLQKLNLAYNSLSGSSFLPEVIGRFANSLTHLNISDNFFSGQIPVEISFLHKLVSLDLSRNSVLQMQPFVLNNLLQNSTCLRYLLIASVDTSCVLHTYLNMSSSLQILDLWDTNLKGRLPNSIFNLPYLERLLLGSNTGLTGPLPKVNMSTDTPLSELDLSYTNLSTGEIIDSIGHFKSLIYLDLSYTISSSVFPDSIGHLKSLKLLSLRSCGLIGPLPRSLVNLRQLIFLDLSFNMLNGTLPSVLFPLPSLEVLYLDSNMLSGGLPSEIFNCQSLYELSLSSNLFDGEIHVGSIRPSFIQLVNLTYLDLAWNNFTGLWDFDTLLSTLPNLVYLDLSYSGLSVVTNNASNYVNPDFHHLSLASCMLTVFPPSLKAMKNLTYLDLSRNNIEGCIPDWAMKNELYYLNLSHNTISSLPQSQWDGLEFLLLQHNQITGPIPPSICNMSNLNYVDLSNNRFIGAIPRCLGNIISIAGVVNLGNNYIHGTIPNVYGDCEYLEGLVLKNNHLEGEVPSSLSKCQSLKVLDLGNNHLNGTFPSFLRELSNLQVVILKSNNLHGIIETSTTMKSSFPSLRVLDLSCNGFVGHIPRKYFQNFIAMKDAEKKGPKPEYLDIHGSYTYYSMEIVVKDSLIVFAKLSIDYIIVDLSNNTFEGEIPHVIGSLHSLKALNLSHNNLNGQIPHAFGQLLEIESLDLSWNQLIGEIPKSLADITSLEVLNLSQNHLVGRIPEGTQFSTFATAFGGNPELCGHPLPNKCEKPHEPAQVEVKKDVESGFTMGSVILGYGCGLIIGFVMGYIMLSTGRPKWFNAIADALIRVMIKTKQREVMK